MTQTTTMDQFLTELPKCEHHVHLEGTLEPDLLFKLAKRNNVTLPEGFPTTVEELKYRYLHFKDLQDFLDLYYIGMSVLQTEQDFEDLAWAYLERSSKEGLKHVEAFFDPQGHTERGIEMDCVVGGFRKALDRAEAELGMSTKLIMCLLRHLPAADCLETLKGSKHYYEKGLIHGLGLDSSEVGFPAELFDKCYAYGRENFPEGTKFTAHAGEEGGPESVRGALDSLKVSRIDHGIHSADDVTLLKSLSQSDTLLTVCPLSNKRLQVVDDLRKLPLAKFLEHNVPFSINSDDPAYFGGYILDNYLAVQEAFGFEVETWLQIAKNSVRGSMVSPERRDALYEEIEQCGRKYTK